MHPDKDSFRHWWKQWSSQRQDSHREMPFLDAAAFNSYLRMRYPEMPEEQLRVNAMLFEADRQRGEWLMTHRDNSRWN